MSHREDSSPGAAAADAPKFREAQPSDSEDSDSDSHSSESPESSSESEDENHPAKQRAMIGPVIPPELKNMSTKEVDKTEPETEENYGPALPPSFAPAAPSVIGPAMPPGFKADQSEVMEEGDDEDMIGPAPHTGDKSEYSISAAADFERRAQAMRNKLNNPNASEGPVQRETWMLELPEKMKVGIGLQARTFKTRNTGEVDSAWTETPADRERREKEAREGEGKKRSHDQMHVQSQRDKEMEEQVEILNAKRQKSLYELHQEKIHGKTKKEKKGKDKKKRKDKKSKEKKKEKKKKEKEKKRKEKEKKPERRPFDRDLDLKVNKFDDAMRKHYIKSAQGLGGKFGHSGGGKYL